MSTKHTPGPGLVAKLDDQAERAVTALELCQRQRDEMREERDAAMAEVERLRAALESLAFVHLPIETINALPEAKGWWPCGLNDRIVRLVRAAVSSSARAAIAKATGEPR